MLLSHCKKVQAIFYFAGTIRNLPPVFMGVAITQWTQLEWRYDTESVHGCWYASKGGTARKWCDLLNYKSLQVALIDFTLSRLVTSEGEIAYCDLENDPELFQVVIQSGTERLVIPVLLQVHTWGFNPLMP